MVVSSDINGKCRQREQNERKLKLSTIYESN